MLQMAAQGNVEQHFFFVTTFKRYQTQLTILQNLQEEIEKDGTLVTKEYIKGRKNVYTHPAVSEYNKTATAANQTVQTLLKIITTLSEHSLSDSLQGNDEL